MLTKKILGVLVTTLVGLTVVVGCKGSKSDPSPGESAVGEALGESAVDGLLTKHLAQSAPTKTQARGTVTCSGDQNNGGRICCDDTHCCININGTINCNLPGRTRKAE